jgi:hypothetical protein
LVPDMDIITEDQDLSIALTMCLWSKRAIQAIPLSVTLGITAAMGMSALSTTTQNSLINWQVIFKRWLSLS